MKDIELRQLTTHEAENIRLKELMMQQQLLIEALSNGVRAEDLSVVRDFDREQENWRQKYLDLKRYYRENVAKVVYRDENL